MMHFKTLIWLNQGAWLTHSGVLFPCNTVYFFFTWWCDKTPQRYAPSCTTLRGTFVHISPRSQPAAVWSTHSDGQFCPTMQPEQQGDFSFVIKNRNFLHWDMTVIEIHFGNLRLGSPGREPDTRRDAAGWTFWWSLVWCEGPTRWPPDRHLSGRYWGHLVSGCGMERRLNL